MTSRTSDSQPVGCAFNPNSVTPNTLMGHWCGQNDVVSNYSWRCVQHFLPAVIVLRTNDTAVFELQLKDCPDL